MNIKEVFRIARMYKDYNVFKSAIDNAMHNIPVTVASDKDYSLVDSDSLPCVSERDALKWWNSLNVGKQVYFEQLTFHREGFEDPTLSTNDVVKMYNMHGR